MIDVVKTAGADNTVKTKYLVLGAGAGQAVLAAVDAVKYRAVGVQVTMAGDGSFKLYHTGTATADNVIAAGQLLTGIPFTPPIGDWGPQIGIAKSPVTIDFVGAGGTLVLHYIELG